MTSQGAETDFKPIIIIIIFEHLYDEINLIIKL